MDTTTELALAMQVAWAIRLKQYFSAIGIVLVLYDGLLTITDEVPSTISRLRAVSVLAYLFWQMRLVWPGSFNFPKVLYYINRYLTAISMLFSTYREQFIFVGRAKY